MKGWKIARIRGVDLEVHISLLLLMPYLIFVTAARYSIVAEGAGIDTAALRFGPWISGTILAIALFVSVVLHEFGHALTAQAQGIKVRAITLMMLGGVSQMERMPEKPYAEFKLAVVGPLVSLGISALMYMIYNNTGSPDLAFFSYWLGSINLVLAIFNMLPAFPLDGGRALRSVLAARMGMIRATRTSVSISKGFAWALGIIGLLSFNILLMLIAFFIWSAAQGELFVLLSKGILKGLKIRDVMVRVDPIGERESIARSAEAMLKLRRAMLPVLTETKLPAYVTLSQVRRVPRDFWRVTLVRDVMESARKIVDANDSVSDVITDLAAAPSGALLVSENGQIVGLVQYSDISELLQFRSLAEEDEEPRRAA